MTIYLVDVADGDEIRQGDLIRRVASHDVRGEWGFVLTADCDIAQRKAGDHYSFIEVVSAAVWLDEAWAPVQLKRFVDKQAKVVSEQLGAVMRRSGLQLGIDANVLANWLQEQTPAQIESAVNRTGKPLDSKTTNAMAALRLALAEDEGLSATERYRRVRLMTGDDQQRIRRSIEDAFEGERGFPDFFLLPELPGVTGYGFVVKLRAIRSVHAYDLFGTEADARIAGRPNAFHRVGRMTDGIRFAITQKLAFLFSRIGLPAEYETSCRSAAELLAEITVPDEV